MKGDGVEISVIGDGTCTCMASFSPWQMIHWV